MSDKKLFSASERCRIADVFKRWAQNHPDPHEPLFYMGGSGTVFSAHGMAQAVSNPDTREAQEIYSWVLMMTEMQDGISLEQFLESFESLADINCDDDVKDKSPSPPVLKP